MPAEKKDEREKQNVEPERWSNASTLFDNGKYSVISDVRETGKLATRWNADTDSILNLPKMAGYALASGLMWHIVPTFLEIPMLHGLLDELAKHSGEQVGPDHSDWIVGELKKRHSAVSTP